MQEPVELAGSRFGRNLFWLREEVMQAGRTAFAELPGSPSFRVLKSIEEERKANLKRSIALRLVAELNARRPITLPDMLERRLYPENFFVDCADTDLGGNLARFRAAHGIDAKDLGLELGWGAWGRARLRDIEGGATWVTRREFEQLLAAIAARGQGLTERQFLHERVFVPAGGTGSRSTLIPWFLIGALALSALGIIWWFMPLSHEIMEREVVARDRLFGFERWRRTFHSQIIESRFAPWGEAREALFLCLSIEDSRDNGRVLVLDARSGGELLSDLVPLAVQMRFYRNPGVPSAMGSTDLHIADLDGDGRNELAYLTQGANYNSCLRVLDDDGAVLGTYCHAGHLGFLWSADLDGEGREMLIVGGTNNAHAGATVLVFDPLRVDGVSAVTDAELRRMDPSGLGDSALYRIIMPGLDTVTMEALGELRFAVSRVQVDSQSQPGGTILRATFGVGGRRDQFGLDLTPDLKPLSDNGLPLFLFDSNRIELRALHREGRIEPDLEDPAFLAAWLARHIRVEGGVQVHP